MEKVKRKVEERRTHKEANTGHSLTMLPSWHLQLALTKHNSGDEVRSHAITITVSTAGLHGAWTMTDTMTAAVWLTEEQWLVILELFALSR